MEGIARAEDEDKGQGEVDVAHPHVQAPAVPGKEKRPLWPLLLVEAVTSSWGDNVLSVAATVAFFAFLSMIPLLILLLTVMGDVLGGYVTTGQIRDLFRTVMPGLSDSTFLNTYWYPVKHSEVATRILGVVSLLFGTMGLHDAVDWAVNRAWKATAQRSFWVSKLRAALTIFWLIGFALLSLVLTWLWALVLVGLQHPSLGQTNLVALVPAVLIDTCVFAALYKLTPNCHVRLPPTLIAGLVAAVLWEASKIVFGWWVVDFGTYNRVYGPLAASVIVMLWLWVSAIVFLYGAKLSALLQHHHWPISGQQ